MNRQGRGLRMCDYRQAMEIMTRLFTRDYQFAMATVSGGKPSLRFVDTYYNGEAFYVVTCATSGKAKDLCANPNVALCSRKLYSFRGRAFNAGHPLLPENAAIRQRLIQAFEPWYFRHNNENSEAMCYLRIEPDEGFFHDNGTGYSVDFTEKTVKTFPFAWDITFTED